MSHSPIFIIVHDRLLDLQKSVKSYETYIKTPYKIIFHNVASTYLPTIDYLNEQKNKGYTVYLQLLIQASSYFLLYSQHN